MQLIRDPDIHSFLKRNLAFLEPREAANNLLLGIAIALSKNERGPFPLLLLTMQKDDTPHFCGLQTIPEDMIVYATPEYLEASIEHLLKYLEQHQIELPGIIGPKFVTSILADQWGKRMQKTWEVKMEQLIYRLDEVEAVNLSPGSFRMATVKDIVIIKPWIEQFLWEVLGDAPEGEAEKIAQQKIQAEQIYLWEDEEVVSMAAVTRPSRHGITVNFVYTQEEHRRKGYATSCVATLSRLMLERGYQFCSLFTDQANPTSNKIYQRIGYRIVEEFQQIKFDIIDPAIL